MKLVVNSFSFSYLIITFLYCEILDPWFDICIKFRGVSGFFIYSWNFEFNISFELFVTSKDNGILPFRLFFVLLSNFEFEMLHRFFLWGKMYFLFISEIGCGLLKVSRIELLNFCILLIKTKIKDYFFWLTSFVIDFWLHL